jgi:hypothetical protein
MPSVDPDEAFEDFLDRIGPLPLAEQREMLLRFFSACLPSMDRGAVLLIRERFDVRDTPEAETLVEVIDGFLALRDLGRD